jgi:hypothetical protein
MLRTHKVARSARGTNQRHKLAARGPRLLSRPKWLLSSRQCLGAEEAQANCFMAFNVREKTLPSATNTVTFNPSGLALVGNVEACFTPDLTYHQVSVLS